MKIRFLNVPEAFWGKSYFYGFGPAESESACYQAGFHTEMSQNGNSK